jgi:hypothetical protein
MSMYVDDYGCIQTDYIVHACMIDPCAEHPGEKPEYLIGFLLHVGHQGYQSSISYPQRHLRNMAFEQLMALVKRETAEIDEEEES